MKHSFYRRLSNFFRTTLIGGLLAVLPLALIVIFFRWIIGIITNFLRPVVELIEVSNDLQKVILYFLAIIALLALFFFIGLIIKTRIGRFINEVLEQKYLMRIPGYKIARDTVLNFSGKNRSFFKEVVLVDVFNSGTLMTGFITDEHGAFYTIFVPTGPNPTSGNIYHINKDRVTLTSASIDMGMKSIIACGAGSTDIFESRIDGEIKQKGPTK